jgi:hypothetical protein
VILNYQNPGSGTFVEKVLKDAVAVYDVMVPVAGKYTSYSKGGGNGLPIWIGKTWYGHYDNVTGAFKPTKGHRQIAWFFLDFNQAALDEQNATDVSEEVKLENPKANTYPKRLQ